MVNNTAIVFTIFDGYVDLWDDAIDFIDRYWVDHPQIYVFTNEIVKEWDNVICIPVGNDAEWSRKAQKAIEVVKEKYMIMLLEDFYVGAAINEAEVQALIYFMEDNNIKYCKLCDNNRIIQKRKRTFKNSKYGVLYADEDYGISLQAAIWEKEFFKEMVGCNNYNAWVFELDRVKESRTAKHEILPYAIDDMRNILNIKHGALQGKMLPNTVKYFDRIGHPLSTSREIMSSKEYARYYIKQFGKDVVPKPAVRLAKEIAKKFGYTFVEEKWN